MYIQIQDMSMGCFPRALKYVYMHVYLYTPDFMNNVALFVICDPTGIPDVTFVQALNNLRAKITVLNHSQEKFYI